MREGRGVSVKTESVFPKDGSDRDFTKLSSYVSVLVAANILSQWNKTFPYCEY